MRRVCIYLTYDKQKVVDRYIGYMLKELKACVSKLIVVCNETNIIRGENFLKQYADEIYFRENKGFDAGGFKDALCDYEGWENILSFDELILVNDSMFGPFRNMKSIFEEMDRKDVDFWGLGKHKDKIYLENIQTYFLVIRSKMLHDHRFREYWEKMPYYRLLGDVVNEHEAKFTAHFSRMGYEYDVLGDMEINNSEINMGNNYLQYAAIQYELIKKRNFPFLKRQPIAFDNLYQQTQENLRQAIDYIDKCTGYDVELIWENVIRTFNITDLQRSLHIQYILPESNDTWKKEIKVVFMVFVSCEASKELVWEYLEDLIPQGDIRIYSEKDDLLKFYLSRNVNICKYNKDDILNLFLELSAYDLVCVLHDTDVTSDREPSCIGKSYFYNIWENLAKNKNYISSVIKKFEEEPRLGFLTNPQPFFARYFDDYGKGWNGKFDEISRIIKEIKLECNVSEDKAPFRITENFWIRGFLFKRLKDIENDNYPYLSYLWTYIAQEAKYYSGIVESLEYASMNEVNLEYYLKQLVAQNRKYNAGFKTFIEMKEKVTQKALEKFCARYSRIFVYGAGYYAQKYRRFINKTEAYVVSDNQIKLKEIDGIAVKYLSEITWTEDCGIVICLSEEKQVQVVPLLEEKGIKADHYFCI